MEVQGLNKRCQSWKLEMMLCIQACYREKVSKFWPLFQNFSYPFTPLHYSGVLSDFILFVEETKTGQGRAGKERQHVEDFAWGVKYAQLTHHSTNEAMTLFVVLEEGCQERGDRGPCFGAELLPKTAWFGGRLPHGPG